MVITLTLNLSRPRKKLMNLIDEIILKAKLRGITEKKLYMLLPLTLFLVINSETVSARAFDTEETKTLDYLYSLVIPITEVIRSKKEIYYLIKYIPSAFSKNNKSF